MKKKKILFSIFTVLSLTLLIIYYIINKSSRNFDNLKIDSTKKIVYTEFIAQAGDYYQYIPTININNSLITDINHHIQEYVSQFEKEGIGIVYEYSISGNILSLIIKVHDHSYAESATVISFQSYNIDLKNKKIVSNNTLFQFFNINEDDINSSLTNGFDRYYHKLVENSIIDSNECDYDCFINGRELDSDLKNVQYFIREGKLIAFKPYVSYTYHEEEENIYDFEISTK